MRIGIDIGGTKLAAIGLDADGRERARLRLRSRRPRASTA